MGITQCRVLNCDFKSYRCKSYYSPILKKIQLNKVLSLEKILNNNNIDFDFPLIRFYYHFLFYNSLSFYKINFYKNINTFWFIRVSFWFTKNTNLQKLYVSGENFFLSPGIILLFSKTPFKFLKKKLKTWISFISALKILYPSPSIIYMNNMFGYKYNLIEKMLKDDKTFLWIFIKLFYLNFIYIKKKKKRIKRWVLKKYFRFLKNN